MSKNTGLTNDGVEAHTKAVRQRKLQYLGRHAKNDLADAREMVMQESVNKPPVDNIVQ
jgi:hypothetical protein